MTWDEIIDRYADALAEAKTRRDFNAILDRIELELADYKNVPAKFWDILAKRYKELPKPLLKEATAAAELYKLLAVAEQTIKARGAQG